MPFCDPADQLDITQTTGTSFDVWLEVIGRIVIAVMAPDLLFALFLEKYR